MIEQQSTQLQSENYSEAYIRHGIIVGRAMMERGKRQQEDAKKKPWYLR